MSKKISIAVDLFAQTVLDRTFWPNPPNRQRWISGDAIVKQRTRTPLAAV